MIATAERLAAGFGWWLETEARLARDPTNPNHIHDNYARLRQGHLLPFGHPDNLSLGKAAGHLTRLRVFTDALIEGDFGMDDERVSAKLALFSLMFTAGAARISTALQSGSQREYERKRFGRPQPHDIDLLPVIEQVVQEIQPEGHNAEGIVAAQALIMRSRIHAKHELTGGWFDMYPRRAHVPHYRIAQPVEYMQAIQREGVRMAAIIAIVAAARQGRGIQDVAVLEPMSVTYAGPIRPFRNQFEYGGEIIRLYDGITVPNWQQQSFNPRRVEQYIAA